MKPSPPCFIRTAAFSTLALCLLVTGCATTQTAQPVRDLAMLSEKEGLLLLVLSSPNERDTRFFFKGTNGNIETPGFPKGTHSMLLKFPQGDYQMTAAYIGSIKVLATDYMRFTIEPHTVTYPGDMVLDGARFNIINLADKRLDAIADTEPALAGWPVLVGSHVDYRRRSVVEGIFQVPNTRGRTNPRKTDKAKNP